MHSLINHNYNNQSCIEIVHQLTRSGKQKFENSERAYQNFSNLPNFQSFRPPGLEISDLSPWKLVSVPTLAFTWFSEVSIEMNNLSKASIFLFTRNKIDWYKIERGKKVQMLDQKNISKLLLYNSVARKTPHEMKCQVLLNGWSFITLSITSRNCCYKKELKLFECRIKKYKLSDV